MNAIKPISVILPVYNGEKYLDKTLNSILNQSFREFELIIINDGSKDNSLSIIESFKENDPRIKLINQENSGICNARNIGIEAATGKYIMFCDHDDIYKERYLEYAYSEICNGTYDFVKFGYEEIFIHNDIIKKKNICSLKNKQYSKADMVKLLFEYAQNNEYVWDGIYSKEIILKCGKFDDFFKAGCEDIDIFLKLIKFSVSCKTSSLICYEHYIRSSTSTSCKFSENTYEAVIKTYLDRLQMVSGSDKKMDIYKAEKTKQFLWSLLGMFSFKSCSLSIDEMKERLCDVEKKYHVKKFLIIKREHGVYKMILELYRYNCYMVLAIICFLKRRLR